MSGRRRTPEGQKTRRKKGCFTFYFITAAKDQKSCECIRLQMFFALICPGLQLLTREIKSCRSSVIYEQIPWFSLYLNLTTFRPIKSIIYSGFTISSSVLDFWQCVEVFKTTWQKLEKKSSLCWGRHGCIPALTGYKHLQNKCFL